MWLIWTFVKPENTGTVFLEASANIYKTSLYSVEAGRR